MQNSILTRKSALNLTGRTDAFIGDLGMNRASVDCRYRSCSNNQHISLVSEVEGQEGEHLCELMWIRKEESHSALLEARRVATQVVSEQGRVSTADTGPAATINTSVWYRRWRGKRGSTSSGQVTVSVRDCH